MRTESTPVPPLRAWVEVDLGALLRNARDLAAHAQAPLIPMVKADAYGLGAVPVARVLDELDPLAFGVATVAEGAELRRAGIGRPVIVFTPLLPSDLPAVAAAGLSPTLSDAEAIRAWQALGGGDWHLAIDTGMSRAGIRWDAVDALADALRASPPASAFTHFHSAELDDGSLEAQEARFLEAVARLPLRPPILHTENSAAIVRRAPSPWGAVRPGVYLYGVGSGPRADLQPRPVAHLHARIVELRDLRPGETVGYDATWTAARPTRIATLPCGYADGYRRHLGNVGRALLHGREVPVAGVVTMDMAMVDVTDVSCALGDVVTLLGENGGKVLSAESVAARGGLSPYELLTGLRQRLPRVLRGGR